MLMKIFCPASKLGTALFLVCLGSSHPPSSSPCPTSSGSNVSQDYTPRIKPHNKVFWASNVREVNFGKLYEEQRRTADVSNRQMFPVWPSVCTLGHSLAQRWRMLSKGNNSGLEIIFAHLLIPVLCWYLQTLGELTQIPSNLSLIQRHQEFLYSLSLTLHGNHPTSAFEPLEAKIQNIHQGNGAARRQKTWYKVGNSLSVSEQTPRHRGSEPDRWLKQSDGLGVTEAWPPSIFERKM